MKHPLPVFCFLLAATAAFGQSPSAAVSASANQYLAAGGQVTFTVTLNYPADAAAVSFSAKPPAATWAYASTAGANVPEVTPNANDTTDPSNPGSVFGWAYQDVPAGAASFTFTLNYPAGLTGDQVFQFKADYRRDNVLTNIPVTAVTIVDTPEAPTITTQPANSTAGAGQNASFTVAATGKPTPTITWQRSTDGGVNWSTLANGSGISGADTATLTVSSVTLAMNNHRFRAVAANGVGTNAISNSATLTVTQAPSITAHAESQAVIAGTAATFTIVASGSGTLTYQWYFTPTGSSTPQSLSNVTGKIAGAQTASLTISNVQNADVGDYVCIVTNTIDSATSHAAALNLAARLVRIVSQTAGAGAQVTVPIQLEASGSENTVSFSLDFDPAVLTYTSSALGVDAAGSTLTRNVTQASTGKLAFLIGKEPGTVYTAGTRTVLTITFTVNSAAAGGSVTPLTFSDSPTQKRIVNASSEVLDGPFVNGSITVSAGFEGDVNENGEVDAADWVKLGRIVVGLDPTPTSSAFMKSDSAPLSSKGNGAVDAADWVQLGRFVVGLDAIPAAGGPSAPAP